MPVCQLMFKKQDLCDYVNMTFGTLELQDQVIKSSYAKWRHSSSY